MRLDRFLRQQQRATFRWAFKALQDEWYEAKRLRRKGQLVVGRMRHRMKGRAFAGWAQRYRDAKAARTAILRVVRRLEQKERYRGMRTWVEAVRSAKQRESALLHDEEERRRQKLRVESFARKMDRLFLFRMFGKLKASCNACRARRRIVQKAVSMLRKRTQSRAFVAWLALHTVLKAKRTAIRRVINRLRARAISLAFSRWQRFFQACHLADQRRRMEEASALQRKVRLDRFAAKMRKAAKSRAFLRMHRKCRERMTLAHLTNKSQRYVELRLFRKYFRAWAVSIHPYMLTFSPLPMCLRNSHIDL